MQSSDSYLNSHNPDGSRNGPTMGSRAPRMAMVPSAALLVLLVGIV